MDGSEWVHDKYDDSDTRRGPQRDYRAASPAKYEIYHPRSHQAVQLLTYVSHSDTRGSKIRVDNIHYELNQDDLDVSYLLGRYGRDRS